MTIRTDSGKVRKRGKAMAHSKHQKAAKLEELFVGDVSRGMLIIVALQFIILFVVLLK